MFKLIRVTGQSLEPLYCEGDYVLVSRLYALFGAIRPGDVVVLRHPAYGLMIKLVEQVTVERDEIFVIGLNDWSVDSREFGGIARKDVLGKVIWGITDL
ncbi:MAG: hypothetical protein EHM70_01520 [Chloroflexota bacterium]|nr:MAG: hypothetical protein EHM70_01520 [Chloroflexota bacterium]